MLELNPRDRAAHRQISANIVATLLVCLILSAASIVRAQDAENPAPHAGMRVTFLPPPMEGTLSLGIYDKKGKLIRVMAREATEKSFIIGLNGLIAFWDGKDDAGTLMPPGIYAARGYRVGAIDVEGIALHGNDWITDEEAPRPGRVLGLRAAPDDTAEVALRTLAGAEITREIHFDTQPPTQPLPEDSVTITGNKVTLNIGHASRDFPLAAGDVPIDAALGTHDRLWLIVRTPTGTEVRAYTLAGEFLRRLSYAPEDPTPQRIVAARGDFASRWSEQILLFEQDEKIQRVRSLGLPQKAADGNAPAWDTVLEKTIWLGDSFDAIQPLLARQSGKPFTAEKEFVVRLIDNPLLKNEGGAAHVNIGYNQTGSYLQTTDGLPLRRITETPNLKWTVIGREGSGKLLTVFQSDGAVVEEFRVKRLSFMMAFDAGEYEWTGK